MRKTKLYQSCHASRPRSCHRSHRRRGITSACAEQTAANTSPHSSTTDHLRVCGADDSSELMSDVLVGSPPRVRSRQSGETRRNPAPGITSACAEQTNGSTTDAPRRRDRLRVCGADDIAAIVHAATEGSPPRVRSRPDAFGREWSGVGITSACAEQTRADDRGDGFVQGSPPRVRSRLNGSAPSSVNSGITSACAEQTGDVAHENRMQGDHLRVCGADLVHALHDPADQGSPPRVRSRPTRTTTDGMPWRITSACAEQTST